MAGPIPGHRSDCPCVISVGAVAELGKTPPELAWELEKYRAAAVSEPFKPGSSVHLSNKNCQLNGSGKCQFLITLNDV